MKFLKFLLSFVIALALVVGLNEKWGQIPPVGKLLDPYSGFWANAENKSIQFAEEINIPGLKEPVNIYFDSVLIPHVYAKYDEDLYRAQGFITAQHRLWQMEFQTHASAGRVAEIIGKDALEFDRYQRRNGLLYGAKNALEKMEEDAETKKFLDAYTAGVNAYINSLSYADLPLEYKLLNYKPEPWTNLKSSLLLKYMANDLAGGDSDAENNLLLAALGRERFDFLFPEKYDDFDPVIPKTREWDFEAETVEKPDSIEFPLYPMHEKMPQPNPLNGSNNWVVSGNKTSTGKPMLANDPHLALNLPSIWYVMHLNSPSMNVFGATLPGALGVIIGFNDYVSWGVTNATRDVRDWYKIDFADDTKTSYKFEGIERELKRVVEEFKIRNDEKFYDTIYYTHHGPIVYDESFRSGNKRVNLALRWTAHDPSNEQKTFLLLNKAKGYNDYEKALTYFDCPAQNFVFASKDNDIALWINGKFPLRWEEQGKFIMDGSRADMDWAGFIPRAHNAHMVNPEQGFLSSANQIPVDDDYPYYHYDRGYEHYRNRRINNTLRKLQNVTIADMKRLQSDNYHLMASEILPAIIDSLEDRSLSQEQKEAFNSLKNWDYMADISSEAAAYFEVLWNDLYRQLWDEFYAVETYLRKPEKPVTISILKNYPNDPFIDNKATTEIETVNDLYWNSFTTAVDSIENWKAKHEGENFNWANFKSTYIQHLARLAPFSTDNVQIGGNRSIVNATSERHGPSWRMIVSLEEQTKAFGVYPGGQSGNPGSYYYDNLIDIWAKGEYLSLDYSSDPDKLSTVLFTQTLRTE